MEHETAHGSASVPDVTRAPSETEVELTRAKAAELGRRRAPANRVDVALRGLPSGGVKQALAILMGLAGCAEGSQLVAREVGPPESGWTSPATHVECAPEDVAPRLHFAKVSHLGWMSARERVALAEADVGHTREGDDAEGLDRLAIDAAVRRMAPVALEAAGEGALAERMRALAPIDDPQDVVAAMALVSRARREAATPAGEQVLAVLETALREPHEPLDRCVEVAVGDTLESAVAAAAVRAGAPRAQITREAVALLEQMASASRAS